MNLECGNFEYEKIDDLFLFKNFKICKKDTEINPCRCINDFILENLAKREIIYIEGLSNFYEVFTTEFFPYSAIERFIYHFYLINNDYKLLERSSVIFVINTPNSVIEFFKLRFDSFKFQKNSFTEENRKENINLILEARKKIVDLDKTIYCKFSKIYSIGVIICRYGTKKEKTMPSVSFDQIKKFFIPVFDKYYYEPGNDGYLECKNNFENKIKDDEKTNEEDSNIKIDEEDNDDEEISQKDLERIILSPNSFQVTPQNWD